MKLRDVLENPPRLHRDGAGEAVSWGLMEEILHFIEGQVTAGAATLETGAGISTILFALMGTVHSCITPNGAEAERIMSYCRQHGIATDRLSFHVAGSEAVLPHQEPTPLDLVLIDGRHAFPTPFIDWYYTADRLKVGGVLVIDDTQLWTGRMLRDFLATEPEWALRAEFSTRAVAFTKRGEGSHRKEWTDQPYTIRNSTEYEGRDIVALTERIAQLEQAHAEAAAYARRLEATLRDTPTLVKLLARRSFDRLHRRKRPPM
jgi:hypothetical protein